MAYMNIAHSSSAGVTATSNASAHTKGNWAQGIASTSEDGDGIVLFLQHGVGANRNFLFDVGLGASSSEVVLVPDIHVRNLASSDFCRVFIPCHIPSGSRVAFRCQDDTGSGNIKFAGYVVPSTASGQTGFSTSAKCVAPLSDTATSAGNSSLDAGAIINTFTGSAGNICNANAPIAATHLMVGTRDATAALVDFLVRIKVNGTVVTPEFYHRGTNADGIYRYHAPVKLDTPIAVNDTVTAEVSCSGNTAGSRELRISVVLMELPAISAGSGGATQLVNGGLIG